MTTLERIEMLAPLVAQFPEMGAFGNVEASQELARQELTDSTGKNTAVPPHTILHIISANTAMAGMQSLVRGLILGSMNWCKIPSAGLPRFVEFVSVLPPELGKLVIVSPTLLENWQQKAEAIVVFGSDETVANFRRAASDHQIFAGYGNRWSGAVVFEDPDFSSIDPLCSDICLYEQKGCLSAQIVWLHPSVNALEYGRRLAGAVEYFAKQNPVPLLNLDEAASIARWRAHAEWKQIESGQGYSWFSEGEPAWGVVLLEKGDIPRLSCLHRHVTLVQKMQANFDFGILKETISTLGVWPNTVPNKNTLARSGASRICSVGQMQFPHPTWRQDGFPALGRLVRWVGIE